MATYESQCVSYDVERVCGFIDEKTMIDEELLELSALCLPKRWYRHEEKEREREREIDR